jgi:hypothetical protein
MQVTERDLITIIHPLLIPITITHCGKRRSLLGPSKSIYCSSSVCSSGPLSSIDFLEMGWFGSSDNNNTNEHDNKSSAEPGFSDSDNRSMSSLYPGGAASSSSSSGLQEFQEFSVQLQQQVLVQTVITDLTQKAFAKCCAAPTSTAALTGKEVACISAVTNKWLDANEFLAGRLQRKQQQQQQQQQFG